MTPQPRSRTLSLNLPGATYDVTVGQGLLASLHPRLQALMAGRPYRPFLVTSPALWKLHGPAVCASFPPDQAPTTLFLPPGEKHKRLASVEALAQQLAQAGADRDALLIAFGGGVVGDLTGFLAAIYMRGVPCVQIPTTLLAQVDSSVGGKTGVNLAAGKNLVGSFHHPRAVLADTAVLATLPPAELRAGLQESVKAAIIRDPTLFRYMESNAADALAGSIPTLTRIIAASLQVKLEVVAADERESGLRMILNFGHTLGHAIEAATGYKRLLHGEAVGWGSLAALHIARARRTITQAQHDRMAALIHAYGPLPSFRASPRRLVALTASDKKARSGRRAFILPTAIGQVEVVYDVTDAELLTAARAILQQAAQA